VATLSDPAVCGACGAGKDLPLARCGACGFTPSGPGRLVAICLSDRVLSPEALAQAAARIRLGEPPNPSAALLERARRVLSPSAEPVAAFTGWQLALLLAGNVLLTPLLGWAAWLRLRDRPGEGARQALIVTVPVSLALAGAWLGLASR
jgi:hypothetical protein